MALAESHWTAGRLIEAEAILRQILSTIPDFHPAHHQLGLIAFESGNLPLAAELIAKAVSLDASVAIYHRNLGELCRRLGRFDAAIHAARRAGELNPNDYEAHYNLGLALSDSGNWETAINAYKTALAVNPRHGLSWNNLGVAEGKLGHQAEAESAYLAAVQLNPRHQEAQSNLYAIYQQQGRLKEARLCLEAANATIQPAVTHTNQNTNIEPVIPPSVSVRDTGAKRGRGVFAQRDFLEGKTVESSPVVIFETLFAAFPTELKTIVFNWGALCKNGSSHAVALGYGSLYNHHNPANMRYQADPERLIMQYIAVRNIAEGEELTVNYNAVGGNASWDDGNWFDRMNVTPIISTLFFV